MLNFVIYIEITPCEFQHDIATVRASCAVGVFVPQCQEDGYFVTKQCWASIGKCCCVDPITGKRTTPWTRRPLECPLRGRGSSFFQINNKWQLLAPFICSIAFHLNSNP
jgi:hypothetical protein